MHSVKKLYDAQSLIWSIVAFLGLCLAMKLTGGSGFVLILPFILVGFSRNKVEVLLYCLMVTTLLTITNMYIAPKDVVFSILNRMIYVVVGGVMGFQLISQRRTKITTPLLSLFPFIVYMAIVSSVGWNPMISYMKLILFVITFLAFYSVSNAVTMNMRVSSPKIRGMFLALSCIVIFGSVCLIPFPGIGMMNVTQFFLAHGYYPEGTLFMGITMQSQALGPTVAVLSVVLLADLFFSVRRWNLLYVLLLICASVLIYKTASRTAMGTFLAGIAFVGFIFMCSKGVGRRWKSRVFGMFLLIVMLAGFAFFLTPTMRSAALRFVYKTHGSEVVESERGVDRIVASRQGLLDNAMNNFWESPWVGHGFQVSESMAGREVSSWRQLISAPIEKGVWVSAVLEEGGIFGMMLFVMFILISFVLLLSRHAFMGCVALFVMLVSNLGEFTFFSMSAMGGIFWIVIFIALIMDAQRLAERRSVYPSGCQG